ncbi:LMBR1 domain-containing protein 2 [Quaeritorhiza haematococci]|nr:LMBR1 domain-containing protein 2 [Quaeritorhiza haematococci]
MAGANAWGLLLSTALLGYGLVEVPRGLWYTANTNWNLRYSEFQAPKLKEAVVDAESEIYEVAREIAIASRKVSATDPLRAWMDKLLEMCPLASDDRGFEDDNDLPATITKDYLKTLHARVKRAVRVNQRNEAQYQFLLQRAFLLQDIVENRDNRSRVFKSIFVRPREDGLKELKLRWYWVWYLWIKPISLRILSLICALATLVLVWSETTFNFTIAGVPLSIPALILQSPYIGYFVLELVSIAFILYMCTCAYSSLFKIKIFDYYQLVPEHHSDEGSLLFVGAYLCRLTFPLCYNFLNMVADHDNSVFIVYQGGVVNLAPLLGANYNNWVPMIILVFCFVTLFNLHGKILRLFRVKNYFYEEIARNDADSEEGRQILEQARTVEERRLQRTPYSGAAQPTYSTHNLTSTDSSSRRFGSKPNQRGAESTEEFLARYRSGGRTSMNPSSGSPSMDIERGTSFDRQGAGAAGRSGGGASSGSGFLKSVNIFGSSPSSSRTAAGAGNSGGSKFMGFGRGATKTREEGGGKFELLRDGDTDDESTASAGADASSGRGAGQRKFGVLPSGKVGTTSSTPAISNSSYMDNNTSGSRGSTQLGSLGGFSSGFASFFNAVRSPGGGAGELATISQQGKSSASSSPAPARGGSMGSDSGSGAASGGGGGMQSFSFSGAGGSRKARTTNMFGDL